MSGGRDLEEFGSWKQDGLSSGHTRREGSIHIWVCARTADLNYVGFTYDLPPLKQHVF